MLEKKKTQEIDRKVSFLFCFFFFWRQENTTKNIVIVIVQVLEIQSGVRKPKQELKRYINNSFLKHMSSVLLGWLTFHLQNAAS